MAAYFVTSTGTDIGKTFVTNALGHIAYRSAFNVRMHRVDALLRLLNRVASTTLATP